MSNIEIIQISSKALKGINVQEEDFQITFEGGKLLEEDTPAIIAVDEALPQALIPEDDFISITMSSGAWYIHALNEEREPNLVEIFIEDEVISLATSASITADILPTKTVPNLADLPAMFSINSLGQATRMMIEQTSAMDIQANHTVGNGDTENPAAKLINDILGESEEAELFLVDHQTHSGQSIRSLISRSRAPEKKSYVFECHGHEALAHS